MDKGRNHITGGWLAGVHAVGWALRAHAEACAVLPNARLENFAHTRRIHSLMLALMLNTLIIVA